MLGKDPLSEYSSLSLVTLVRTPSTSHLLLNYRVFLCLLLSYKILCPINYVSELVTLLLQLYFWSWLYHLVNLILSSRLLSSAILTIQRLLYPLDLLSAFLLDTNFHLIYLGQKLSSEASLNLYWGNKTITG
jgi:hypothetical protein